MMESLFNSPSVPAFLENAFQIRKKRNSKYSKRAFARDLNMSAGRLTEILNSKRNMTYKVAQNISHILKLSSDEENYLFQLVSQQTNLKTRKIAKRKIKISDQISDFYTWRHHLIMCILQQPFDGDILQYLSQKLNISTSECVSMLNVLEKNKLIIKDINGYKLISEVAFNAYDFENLISKSYYEDLIKEQTRIVKSLNLEQAEVISVIFSLDKKDLLRAKKMIKAFVEMFQVKLDDKKKKEVYGMTILMNPFFTK